jgi:cytochrome c oxidase assembly protein subunit 15
VGILAWTAVAAVFLQLIVGATMRHMGAGLAIPTFPAASPEGALLPILHVPTVEINFTHTRVGALFVTVLIIALALSTFRTARGDRRLVLPACTLLALVALQLTLGVLVVFHSKPPTLTTFHVLNGALMLATTLLLALRIHSSIGAAGELELSQDSVRQEVLA